MAMKSFYWIWHVICYVIEVTNNKKGQGCFKCSKPKFNQSAVCKNIIKTDCYSFDRWDIWPPDFQPWAFSIGNEVRKKLTFQITKWSWFLEFEFQISFLKAELAGQFLNNSSIQIRIKIKKPVQALNGRKRVKPQKGVYYENMIMDKSWKHNSVWGS